MPSPQCRQLPSQAFNDVLARMMQAEVNRRGPPPATPCDTPVEVISQIHMKDPAPSPSEAEDVVHTTKIEFARKLNEKCDRLRDDIREMQTKSVSLKETALAKWHTTIADIEAKQKLAREKIESATTFTGEAWEHLRDAAKHA